MKAFLIIVGLMLQLAASQEVNPEMVSKILEQGVYNTDMNYIDDLLQSGLTLKDDPKVLIGCIKEAAEMAEKIPINLELEEICEARSFEDLGFRGLQNFIVHCRELNQSFKSSLSKTQCKSNLIDYLTEDTLFPELNRLVMIRNYCQEKSDGGYLESIITVNEAVKSKVSELANRIKHRKH